MYRSMVYVEGDTTYHNYTDAEGNTKKSLSIVQRTSSRA